MLVKRFGVLPYLELSVVVGSLYQVHESCQPSLLFNRFVRLHALSLQRAAGVPCRLLRALSDQNLDDLQHRLQIFCRRDLGLISQQTPCDLAGDCPSCRIGLRVEKRNEAWQGQCCEQGNVRFDGGKEEVEDVGLGGLRVQIRTIGVLLHLFVGKGEYAIYIVEAVGVNVSAKVSIGMAMT